MSELSDLYQQVIIDHGRKPRNFYEIKNPTCSHEGFNPLCGDQVKVFVKLENDRVMEVSFTGSGCAISTAAASLMTEIVKGKTIGVIEKIFLAYQNLVKTGSSEIDLDKLAILAGVAAYPMRVKCATLVWHTLIAALHDEKSKITTEA